MEGSSRNNPHEIYKCKYRLRAACQSVAFVALVVCYLLYNHIKQDTYTESARSRRTEQALKNCDDLDKADPVWFLVFYCTGVLYMFIAIAIACDEFFVPALEEIANRLNMSMDVAGATLMAAGGSAPELFTSLFGTFYESEIGIGNIIGSAVFNVLFVIAMCSFFAKEASLPLTWWPLFRDSTYYSIGLVVQVLDGS
jgi:Ca2+/H+ antiporter